MSKGYAKEGCAKKCASRAAKPSKPTPRVRLKPQIPYARRTF